MRILVRSIAAATILSAASLAPMAYAAEHAEGVVKQYDTATRMLTLQDGKAFVLPQNFKEAGLKTGTKVDVAYAVKDGKNMAETVKIMK